MEQAFSPTVAQETRLWACPFPPPSERVATLGHQRPSPGLGPPHSELQGCFSLLPVGISIRPGLHSLRIHQLRTCLPLHPRGQRSPLVEPRKLGG